MVHASDFVPGSKTRGPGRCQLVLRETAHALQIDYRVFVPPTRFVWEPLHRRFPKGGYTNHCRIELT